MPIEILSLLTHRDHRAASVVPGALDADFLIDRARAFEAAGFDAVMLANSSAHPDNLTVAAWLLAKFERLRVIVSHRPGFIAPTMTANLMAQLDRLSGGRCGLYLITADGAEMQEISDAPSPTDWAARAAEYAGLLKRIWAGEKAFDHAGRYYRFETVSGHQPEADIPIYWSCHPAGAIEAGGEVADVFLLPGLGLDVLRDQVVAARNASHAHGRRARMMMSVRVVVADTEEEAWRQAGDLLQRSIDSLVRAGEMSRDEAAAALASTVRTTKEGVVWNALGGLPGARSAIRWMVGTPAQLRDALLEYYALGVTDFMLSGDDPHVYPETFGASLIPLLREGAAARDAAE